MRQFHARMREIYTRPLMPRISRHHCGEQRVIPDEMDFSATVTVSRGRVLVENKFL
jgi:hypothetical protein